MYFIACKDFGLSELIVISNYKSHFEGLAIRQNLIRAEKRHHQKPPNYKEVYTDLKLVEFMI